MTSGRTRSHVMASGSGSPVASLLIFALPVPAHHLHGVHASDGGSARSSPSRPRLSVGDEVCTTSGLFGTITALDDTIATLEISPGVTVRFDRRAIGTKARRQPAASPTHPAPPT